MDVGVTKPDARTNVIKHIDLITVGNAEVGARAAVDAKFEAWHDVVIESQEPGGLNVTRFGLS